MRERDKVVILPDGPVRSDGLVVLPEHLWDAAEMAGLDLTGYVRAQPLATYDRNIIPRRSAFLWE